MDYKNCLKCNKEFSKRETCSKKEWATSKFCSKSCANSINSLGTKRCVGRIPWNKGKKFNSKQNLISLVCKECGGYFQVENYRKDVAQFCSRLCATNNSNQGKTPANEKIRKSAAYKSWRTLVFERDNYTCVQCNIHGGYLHADHIKPFALFPELRLAVDNGRTLCVPCHKKTDTYGRKSMYRKNLTITQES